MDDIIARSVPLVFTEAGGCGKWYARTPGGELAWSDGQGLYEWRRTDGEDLPAPLTGLPRRSPLQRTDYTGGDRQASDSTGFFRHGPAGSAMDVPPAVLGFHAAVSPARLN